MVAAKQNFLYSQDKGKNRCAFYKIFPQKGLHMTWFLWVICGLILYYFGWQVIRSGK